jgi:phosphatidylinositol alpha-1,6-mannosyltransferase
MTLPASAGSSPHLVLTFDFPPTGGGIARWLAEMARHYPPGGMVISTGSWPRSAVADAEIPQRVDRLDIPSTRLRTPLGLARWSQRAQALVSETGADFIWCGNLKPAGYPARWVHARTDVPYAIIFHGTDLLKLEHHVNASYARQTTARALIGSAAVCVANSRWTMEVCNRVLDRLGLETHNRPAVRAVQLGTDPRRFQPGLDSRDVRDRYGLGDRRWLLTVARLVEHKGVDNGIRAFALLAADYPDLGYAVAGEGEIRPSLEALARSLGVGERVRFLGGVPDDCLPRLLNAATIYLGLSREMHDKVEGFGIALVEASACGVPVVGGASGGIPDAVRDGETGLLTDPESPPAIAATLRRLLEDEVLRARLGAGGRAAVESHYNWERVTADMRAIAAEFGGMNGRLNRARGPS